MKNRILAEMFAKMADALEFKGENPFKVNAYRKASRVIGDLRDDIEVIYREGKLKDIPGVGSGIAKKVEEYLKTGRMAKFEEVTAEVPEGLVELMSITGLGPKTLALAHRELGVKGLEDLERVIEDGSLATLPGMGAKKVENIKRGIRLYSAGKERIPLGIALPLVEQIIGELKGMEGLIHISPAGSLRRMKETIGDIDILATGHDGGRMVDYFVHLPQVVEVLAAGETKGSVIVEGGLQVDLRVVPPESFGAAMQYFTGSKAHNIRLRDIAKERGLKVNEYGVFRGKRRIGGEEEADVYFDLGLPWIPPEMREDRGEIELATSGQLPGLVEEGDIRGDFHVHSKYSDGSASLEEIALQARELGYEYVVITDHSRSLKVAGGLSEKEVLRKIEEIRQVNERVPGVRLLASTEVDIRTDGSLDYPDEILAKLDLVMAAIHSAFRQDPTGRMIKAMHHPYVHIIAHPTGRLLSKRESYEVDLDRLLQAARDSGTWLEINAHYDRLDLDDMACRKAKELGVRLAIGTDAHHLNQLWMIRLGTAVARRGWLEPADVVNTFPLGELLGLAKKKARG